jgi:uncharacterized protein (TIGR02265 family)
MSHGLSALKLPDVSRGRRFYVQQMKGAVLKARVAFIEEHFGKDGVQKVLARLDKTDRAALQVILPIRWYPFELGERMDAAIVSALGNGDPRFFERLGSASAERNLLSVHKGFLRPGDPHAFLRNTQVIFRTYYEIGRREYESTGKTSAVLTTYDAEAFSAPDCLTIIGWHRKALEMCGATGVEIRETQCRAKGGTVCRYEISWNEISDSQFARD